MRRREAASSSRACALASRERDELGERLHAALRVRRLGLVGAEGRDERSPGRAGELDRHRRSTSDAGRADALADLAGHALVRSRCAWACPCGGRPSKRGRSSSAIVIPTERADALAVARDDRRRVRALEALEHRRADLEQPAHLLGHVVEHLLGRDVRRDERRDAAQRRLLLAEPPLLRLDAALLGEVADDRHDLVDAARHHARFEVAPDAVDLQVVLERAHRTGLERALDAREHAFGHVGRQDVAHVRADVRRGRDQQRRRPGSAWTSRHVPSRLTRNIVSGIASSSAWLRSSDPLQRLERALVREREAGRGGDGVEQLGAETQRAVVDEQPDPLAADAGSASRPACRPAGSVTGAPPPSK